MSRLGQGVGHLYELSMFATRIGGRQPSRGAYLSKKIIDDHNE